MVTQAQEDIRELLFEKVNMSKEKAGKYRDELSRMQKHINYTDGAGLLAHCLFDNATRLRRLMNLAPNTWKEGEYRYSKIITDHIDAMLVKIAETPEIETATPYILALACDGFKHPDLDEAYDVIMVKVEEGKKTQADMDAEVAAEAEEDVLTDAKAEAAANLGTEDGADQQLADITKEVETLTGNAE